MIAAPVVSVTTPDYLPMAVVIACLAALNVVFLKRLLTRADSLDAAVCGTPETPGIAEKVRRIEEHLGINSLPYDGPNRRRPVS